ncbi:MAG: gamma-glutamyltransferase [Magnetovibrionaceae bacterium]
MSRRFALAGAALLGLSACAGGDVEEGRVGFVEGFLGLAVAEEPRATVIGRDVLSSGGTAADAAVAMATTLTVTMPGAASLGGGGACVIHEPPRRIRTQLKNFDLGEGSVASLMFLADQPDLPGGMPAAVPAMPRGLFALHARYGAQAWTGLIGAAENMARFGSPVSRASLRHLQGMAGVIQADPELARIFSSRSGPGLPKEGERLVQVELATQLGRLRTQGAGDFYSGQAARALIEAAPQVGAEFDLATINGFQPQWGETLKVQVGNHEAHFPAGRFIGGEVAARLLEGLKQTQGAGLVDLARRTLRQTSGITEPSATGFTVVDRDGLAVACTLTTNGSFGAGRMVPGLGYVLARPATSAREAGAAQTPFVVFNANNNGFYMAGTGADGALAPAVLADTIRRVLVGGEGLREVLSADRPTLAGAGSGLVHGIACPDGLPPNHETCTASPDPFGAGLALRGEE